MGSQFAIVYDILIAVVLVFAIFSGAKRGFVSAVVGIAAVFVGFFCAMTFSAPLTELVYTSMVEKPLTEAVSQTLDDNMSSITLSGLSEMDFDSVKISGTPVSEITPDYSGTDKVVIDLSNVDLSGTGFESADLSKFGFGSSEDYAHMNGKTAEFTMADINAYGLGKLATAQVIAVKLAASPMISGIQEYVGIVGGLFPAQFQDISKGISDGEISMVRSLVLTMIDCSSSVKSAVIDHMLRPAFTLVMKTIFFAVIFIVVSCVLDIVARLLKVVNKVPVIGSVNGLLGGVCGAVSGLISICVICILVRFVVTLSGGNVLLLNDTAIDSTFVFRYFYNFEFLNFLT